MHLHVKICVVTVLSNVLIQWSVDLRLILFLVDLIYPSVEPLGQKSVNIYIILFVVDEVSAHILPQAVYAFFV